MTGPGSALLAFLIAGIINAAAIVRFEPKAPQPSTRWWMHGYDAGHFLAMALAGAFLCGIHVRAGRRRSVAFLGLAALSIGVGALVLPDDLDNGIARLAEEHGQWLFRPLLAAAVGAVSLGVPIAWAVARLAGRPWLRWVGVLAGMAAFGGNAMVLPSDYRGIHLYIALAGGALLGASFAGAQFPGLISRVLRRLRFLRTPLLALASLLAAASLALPPKATVAVALTRAEGSVLPPFLLPLHTLVQASAVNVPPQQRPWFESRLQAPPVPTTGPSVLPAAPIVIVLSIDALRADILYSGKQDEKLPVLSALKRRSTWFKNARAPGAQTAYTLSTIFSGTYFCQQYWTASEKSRALFPYEDPTVRFPEVLQKSGVQTVTFAAAPWLVNDFGVARGFTEETYVPRSRSYYTPAKPIVDAALPRLEKQGPEPLFFFIHFLDPHAPYDLAGKKGSEQSRYVGEISQVDAEIGRILAFLDSSPLGARTAVIVTADHGEAFGEHGRKTHANSLYDELLRVPLLVSLPGGQERAVDDLVSLVDLGPTILDLFGQPTPGHFLGQSLMPFFRGERPKLDRPIVAETRLLRSLVLPEGLKVIVDDRAHTVELYDLKKDPKELHNLADDSARLQRPLALLRKFLNAHTIQREGYEVPYRR